MSLATAQHPTFPATPHTMIQTVIQQHLDLLVRVHRQRILSPYYRQVMTELLETDHTRWLDEQGRLRDDLAIAEQFQYESCLDFFRGFWHQYLTPLYARTAESLGYRGTAPETLLLRPFNRLLMRGDWLTLPVPTTAFWNLASGDDGVPGTEIYLKIHTSIDYPMLFRAPPPFLGASRAGDDSRTADVILAPSHYRVLRSTRHHVGDKELIAISVRPISAWPKKI